MRGPGHRRTSSSILVVMARYCSCNENFGQVPFAARRTNWVISIWVKSEELSVYSQYEVSRWAVSVRGGLFLLCFTICEIKSRFSRDIRHLIKLSLIIHSSTAAADKTWTSASVPASSFVNLVFMFRIRDSLDIDTIPPLSLLTSISSTTLLLSLEICPATLALTISVRLECMMMRMLEYIQEDTTWSTG